MIMGKAKSMPDSVFIQNGRKEMYNISHHIVQIRLYLVLWYVVASDYHLKQWDTSRNKISSVTYVFIQFVWVHLMSLLLS